MASYYLKIKDAKVTYKNFRGLEKDKNVEGSRNLALIISPDDEFHIDIYDNGEHKAMIGNYQTLIDQGWNIREHVRRDGDGNRIPTGDYVLSSVKINFYPAKYAPTIRYYANPDSKSFVILNEDLLNPMGELGRQIDENGFTTCNICVRGYNDQPGHVSAFVSEMVIVGKPSIFDEWGYGEEFE